MPQARSGGSSSGAGSSGGSRSSRSSSAKSSRAKSGSAKSGSSRGGGASKSGSSRSAASRTKSTRSSASRSTSSARSGTARARSTRSAGGTGDVRLDAAAQRLRKLNERIIEGAKEAGETTLTSYEKALKTIAGAIERGPGSSEVEWISNLATAQAKFIRDLTTSWTSAARKALK